MIAVLRRWRVDRRAPGAGGSAPLRTRRYGAGVASPGISVTPRKRRGGGRVAAGGGSG
jgi:hypothetical protein